MKITYRCMDFEIEEISKKEFRVFSKDKVNFDLVEASKNMAIIMAQCHIDNYYKKL